MNKQNVPAYILLIPLVCFGVFLDAPVIPRLVKIPCYAGPPEIIVQPPIYLNGTEWMSPSYALFGIGVLIPPTNPCVNLA